MPIELLACVGEKSSLTDQPPKYLKKPLKRYTAALFVRKIRLEGQINHDKGEICSLASIFRNKQDSNPLPGKNETASNRHLFYRSDYLYFQHVLDTTGNGWRCRRRIREYVHGD